MSEAVYGCDGCRTSVGGVGCPTHGIVFTRCIHGLDLTQFSRCYLCRPLVPKPAAPNVSPRLDRDRLAWALLRVFPYAAVPGDVIADAAAIADAYEADHE